MKTLTKTMSACLAVVVGLSFAANFTAYGQKTKKESKFTVADLSYAVKKHVKEESQVTISVFNVCGQKIATLVNNNNHPVGRFTATFIATNLFPGMYYYTINIDNSIVERHKMIMIK